MACPCITAKEAKFARLHIFYNPVNTDQTTKIAMSSIVVFVYIVKIFKIMANGN